MKLYVSIYDHIPVLVYKKLVNLHKYKKNMRQLCMVIKLVNGAIGVHRRHWLSLCFINSCWLNRGVSLWCVEMLLIYHLGLSADLD